MAKSGVFLATKGKPLPVKRGNMRFENENLMKITL